MVNYFWFLIFTKKMKSMAFSMVFSHPTIGNNASQWLPMKSMAFSMVFSHPTIGNNASQWLPIIGPSAILFWSGPGKPGARSLGLYVTLSLRE